MSTHRTRNRVPLECALLVIVIAAAWMVASAGAAASAPPAPRQAHGDRRPLATPVLGWRAPDLASVLTPDLLPWHTGLGRVGLAAQTGTFGSALVGSAPAGNGASAVAVDSATNTIYVANGNNANGGPALGNTVSVIDARGCYARHVAHCRGPWPTVTVGNEPSTLAVDETTDTVYVTNVDDNTVSVIDGSICNSRVTSGCGQVPATVPVGSGPIGVFADDVNDTVYVANWGDGTVSMIDSARCNGTHLATCPATPPPTLAVASGPGDVDVNQTTHTAYVATLTGLSAFDTNTCNATVLSGCGEVGQLTWCATCYGPFSAKVDPENNTIYEGDGGTTVAAIDGRACNADDLAGCQTAPYGTLTLPSPSYEHVLWVAVDAPLHTVYVLLHKDDTALVIDANVCSGQTTMACATLTPSTIHTGANPESIALDAHTQTLYTANEVDNSVSVIDASRCNAASARGCRRRPPTVPVPAAGGIAVDAAVHTVYATSGANAVALIDTRSCNALHPDGCAKAPPTVTVGDFPQAIAVDRVTQTVYVANYGADGSGTVSVVDARHCNRDAHGCAARASIPIPAGNPGDIAVNAVTGTIYVATITSGGSNVLSVLDGRTCNARRTSGCSQTPSLMTVGESGGGGGCSLVAVAVDETTNSVYATNTLTCTVPFQGDKVYVYDGATCDAADTTGCGQTPATVSAGFNPSGIVVDPTTRTVYTPLLADGEHPGSVAAINAATCNGSNTSGCAQPPATAPAGFGSTGVAVDLATHRVYVTNDQDTSVSVIDGAGCNGSRTSGCGRPPEQLATDDYPGRIAVDTTTGTAYISGGSGTVSVVPLIRSRFRDQR